MRWVGLIKTRSPSTPREGQDLLHNRGSTPRAAFDQRKNRIGFFVLHDPAKDLRTDQDGSEDVVQVVGNAAG